MIRSLSILLLIALHCLLTTTSHHPYRWLVRAQDTTTTILLSTPPPPPPPSSSQSSSSLSDNLRATTIRRRNMTSVIHSDKSNNHPSRLENNEQQAMMDNNDDDDNRSTITTTMMMKKEQAINRITADIHDADEYGSTTTIGGGGDDDDESDDSYLINIGDDSDFARSLFLVHGIPVNITNIYRGKWTGFISDSNYQQQHEQQQKQRLSYQLLQKINLFDRRSKDDHTSSSTSSSSSSSRRTNENETADDHGVKQQKQQQQQQQQIVNQNMKQMNGELSMKLKSSETVLKEFMFMTGDVHLRQGHYLHDRYRQLVLDGVYNIYTNVMYFYLRPPHLLHVKLQGTRALFNDTGAQLAYELTSYHHSEARKNEMKESQSAKMDLDNSCIFKGLLQVKKMADMREQEEQYRSFTLLSEEDKLRRSIFLSMKGQLIGLNCNSTIQISESTYSVEKFFDKAISYSVIANIVIFVQVLALIFQMNFTNTQSSAARVSPFMVAQQAMIDSYYTLLHLTIGIFIEGVFDSFTVTTFLSFILFSIFEMRYLLAVWKATRPETFRSGWAMMRQELQRLYFRFYGFVFGGLLIVYHYPPLFKYAMFVLYSFWIPQIFTNVVRISKTSVHPVYVAVVSITRLVLPSYFLLCPSNFAAVQNQPALFMWLGLWVAVQAAVLIMQHIYGPRWFIPRLFEAKKYNYYRSIPQELTGEGEVTCVICMHPIIIDKSNAIEMEDSESTQAADSGHITLSTRTLTIDEGDEPVVTQCSHVFHEACLRRWMAYSSICPTCRAPLDDGL